MRKRSILLISFIATIGGLAIQSFTVASRPDNCGVTRISKANAKASHFFGLNCMSCHKDGRKGYGCFTVAGSVLDEDRSFIHKNPVIKLYSEPQGKGKLIATIQGDALGNFYTTESIDFGTGIYATLVGSPDAAEPVKHMRRPLIKGMGQCNKCHGFAEEALGID